MAADELDNEPPPTPEELAGAQAPATSGGPHPLPTDVQVKEPDGAPASLGAGQAAPDDLADEPPPTAQELAGAQGPKPEGELSAPGPTENEQLGRLVAYRATHNDTPPEKQLEVMKYATAAGLPPDVVEHALESVKKVVDQDAIAQALAHAPKLQKYLEDVSKAPLVKDDLGTLGRLEAVISGRLDNYHWMSGGWGEAWKDEVRSELLRGMEAEQMKGNKSPALDALIDSEEASIAQHGTHGATSWLGKQAMGIPGLAGFIGGNVLGAAAGAAAAASSMGPEAAPVGAFAGAFGYNTLQNAGPLYRELRAAKRPDGTPLMTDEEASHRALLWSSAVGLAFATPMGPFLKYAGLGPVLNRFGGEVIQKSLASPGIRTALTNFAKQYPVKVLEGSALMTFQRVANDLAMQTSRMGAGLKADWDSVVRRGAETFADSTKAMALIAGVPAVGHALSDLGMGARAGLDGSKLDAMAQEAQQSALLKRSPREFETAVRLFQGERPQFVYADAPGWKEYWEGKGQDPGAVAARVMGDGGKAWAEAQGTGADLAFPVEKYLATMAEEHTAPGGLRDYVRLTQDGVSVRQMHERVKAAVEAEANAPKDGADVVAQHYAGQAMGADRGKQEAEANGALVGRFFRAVGKGLGMSADEAYQRFADVRIHRGEGGEATDFNFGANAAPEPPSQDALDFIGRMRPDNREAAQAFLEYAQGKREKRPVISPDLEKSLARYGVVDPAGFTFGEDGRSLERALGGRKVFGSQPDELRRYRENSKLDTYLGQQPLPDATGGSLHLAGKAPIKPAERGRELYLDPVSGIRNADAFDETPVPEGKRVAVITTPAVKGINDNLTAGGHDVANDMLSVMGNAAFGADEGAARGGTNFRVLVDAGKEKEQLAAAVEKVKAALGNPNIDVVGAVGKDSEEAFKNLRAETDRRRALKPEETEHLPQRGALRPGLDVAGLKYERKAAGATVPEHLVEKAGAMTPKEYFERAYLDHAWHTGADGKRVAEPSGLLNARGFDATPPKAFTLSMDMVGLGKVPKEVGDDILRIFSRAAVVVGGEHVDAARLSGDEFAGKHDDPAVLHAYAERLNGLVKDAQIPYVDQVSGKNKIARVEFRHGVGADYAEADRQLNFKRKLQEQGADGGPGGLDQSQAPGHQLQGQADLERGRALLDQGPNRPAAWPYPEEVNRLAQPGRAAPGPLWFSQAEKATEAAKQEKGNATSWQSVISKSPGVKKEELDYMGLPEWLAKQKGSISKQQVLDFIRAHRVEVTEKVLGEPPKLSPEAKKLHAALVGELQKLGLPVDKHGLALGLYKDDGSPDLEARALDELAPDKRAQARRLMIDLGDLENNQYGPTYLVNGEPLTSPRQHSGNPERVAAELVYQVRPDGAVRELNRLKQAAEQRLAYNSVFKLDGKSASAFATDSPEGQLLSTLNNEFKDAPKGFGLKEALEAKASRLEKSVKMLEGSGGKPKAVQEMRQVAELARSLNPSRISMEAPDNSLEPGRIALYDAALGKVEDFRDKDIRVVQMSPEMRRTQYNEYRTDGSRNPTSYRELLFYTPSSKAFAAPHFHDEGRNQGLLAHARFSEHTTESGEKVLMVDEIQSDLHQQGRERGYLSDRTTDLEEYRRLKAELEPIREAIRESSVGEIPKEALERRKHLLWRMEELDNKWAGDIENASLKSGKAPDAPFKSSWEEMVAKRMLRWAAENGYAKMAWTTGKTQAERYGLGAHVDSLRYLESSKKLVGVKNGENVFEDNVEPGDLPQYVGQDVAKRLLEAQVQKPWKLEEREGNDGETYYAVVDESEKSYGLYKDLERARHDVDSSNAEYEKEHGTQGYRSLKVDAEVGAQGMRAAYDVRLPSIVNKLVKKYGGHVEKEALENGDAVHTATIPEAFSQQVVREGMPLFQPPEGGAFRLTKDGNRGYITFSPADGSGEPRKFDIHLLEGADKSTLAHETGHFLAEVLGDVASQPDAPEALKADYQKLLEWMGHASHEERVASAAERRELTATENRTPEQETRLKELTAKEERFSHGWEQYLMEGKAPTPELLGAFTRFRGWLTSIYRSLGSIGQAFKHVFGEEVRLTDEVRGIFDRLLASEDEIQKAQEAVDAVSPFGPALEHMTPEERAEYAKVSEAARTQAEDELRRRLIAANRQENSKWMQAERERVRGEVDAELDSNQAYHTLKVLQEGDTTGLLGDTKLDRSAVAKAMGKDFAATLPPGVYAPKGEGRAPDELAALLGWEDGRQMLETLAKTQPREELLNQETQSRMEARFGPGLLDKPDELAREAMDAVHTPEQARRTVLELNALRRALKKGAKDAMAPDKAAFEKLKDNTAKEAAQAKGDAQAEAQRQGALRAELLQRIDPEVVRKFAQDMVAQRTVGELTAGEKGLAGQYERAERTFAKRALEAAAKGDYLSATALKEKQLLNQELYRSASELRKEMEKAQGKLEGASQPNWRAALGKAGPEYRDASDAILKAVGVTAPDGQRGSIDGFLDRAKADAQDVAFDADAVKQLLASPKALKDMTPDEARTVRDAVLNIKHAANAATEVELAGKRQSTDAFFQELEQGLKDSRKPLPLEPVSRTEAAKGVVKTLRHWGRGADATLANMETIASMLDGGKRDGPAHRLLVDSRLEARTKETELQKKVLEPIRKAFDAVLKDIRKLRDQRVGDINGTPIAELLPVRPDAQGRLAPIYTRDNLWSLFLNWGNEGNRQRIRAGNGWSDSNVLKALSLLSPEECDFLQTVLHSVGSFGPELQKVHEARTGLPLELVKATPIEINGRTYEGGYFPIRYDSRFARQGAVQDASAVASLFPAGYTPPYVGSGHAKARLDNVAAPIDLSWGVLPAHIAQVTHDIAYGDWVRQAGRLVMDRGDRWRQLATQYLGPEYAKEFIPWLRDVANARADSASGAASEFLGEVGGLARGRLAVGVMGLNIPSLSAHLMDPLTTRLNGVPLRHIASAYLKTMARGIPLAGGLIDPAQVQLSPEMQYREAQFTANLRKSMVEMGPNGKRIGAAINDVIFKAHEMLEHFTTTVAYRAAYEHALSEGATTEAAVKRADDVVRQNLPSSDIGDKPRFLREKRGIAAAVMFYGYANKLYNQLSRAGHEGGPGRLAASALYLGFVGAGAAFLAGRGPDPDEDKASWLARKVLLDPLNTIPVAGGVVSSLVEGKKVDLRTIPEFSFINDTANRLHHSWKLAQDGNTTDEEKLFGVMQTVAGALGPVHQAQRTIGYVQKVVSGESQPRGPFDVASGLVHGERPGQPLNPFLGLQNIISGQ